MRMLLMLSRITWMSSTKQKETATPNHSSSLVWAHIQTPACTIADRTWCSLLTEEHLVPLFGILLFCPQLLQEDGARKHARLPTRDWDRIEQFNSPMKVRSSYKDQVLGKKTRSTTKSMSRLLDSVHSPLKVCSKYFAPQQQLLWPHQQPSVPISSVSWRTQVCILLNSQSW